MRVLVVDDTADNRLILERLLRADGVEVTVAASGEEALEVLARATFDVVLLDLMMPGLDGFETLAAYRESVPAGPPVLALTARLFPEDIEKCERAGFAAHVPKPVTRRSLQEALAPYRTSGEEAAARTQSGPGARADDATHDAAQGANQHRAIQDAVDALRPAYLARRREDLEELKAALGRGDLAAMGRTAHRIAGSAATYGFAALTDVARDLEVAAMAKDAIRAGDAVRRLAEALAEVLATEALSEALADVHDEG